MRKLATLLTLFSLGLFSVGCTEVEEGPEPIPGEAPAVEGGSGEAGTMVEEGTISEDAPPTTDDIPPAITEPETSEPGADADPTAPNLEASAEETPSATEAAETADTPE